MAFEDIQNVDQPLQQESQLQDENQIQQDTDASLPVIDLDAAEQQDPPTKAQRLYRNLLNTKNEDGSSRYTKDVLGSEDEFSTALSDSAKADNIYSKLVSDGFTVDDIGDKNEFLNTFVVKKKDGGLPSPTGAQVDANGLPIAPLKSVSALADQKEWLPPQEEEDPNDFIAKARKASKLRTTATSVSVSGGTGGAAVTSITDPNIVNQANAIDEEVKAAGYDPNELVKDTNGINAVYFQNPAYSSSALLDDYKNNKQLYNRKIATAQSGSDIYNIDPKAYNVVATAKNNINTPGLDYNTKRANVKTIVSVVNNLNTDQENKSKILNNLYTEFSYAYASTPIRPDNDLLSKLSENQIIAYNALQDLQPTEANRYSSVLIDNNDIKDNHDAQVQKEIAGKRLEELGISMKKNWATENANKYDKEYGILYNKVKDGTATEEEYNRTIELEQKIAPYKQAYNDLDNQEQLLSEKYPVATHLDARNFAQELIGQETNAVYNLLGKTGLGLVNTAEGAINMIKTPFITDQQNEINQAELLGNKAQLESLMYQTQEKGYTKTFEPKISAELKAQVDAIKSNNSLTYDQRLQKTWGLLADNPTEWERAPIEGGKTNISSMSLLYGIGNMASALAPFLLAESVTGGGATAGYASKFMRTFTAAALSSFNDEYAAAIDRGSKSAYSDAMISTAINSAAMAGAGAPDAIRRLLGNKTAIGKLVNKLSDKEIAAALRNEPKALGLLKRSYNIGKNVGEATVAGVKEAGKFVAATTTGKIVNDAVMNDLKTSDEYVHDAALEFMNMSVFNVGLGVAGKAMRAGGLTNVTDITKDVIHSAASKPVEFLRLVDQKLKDGVYTPKEAKQITNNIMNANRVLQSTPMLDAEGNPLTQESERDLLFLKMQKNDAEAMLNKDISKDLASKIGDRLVGIDENIDKIYKGTLLEKAPVIIQPSRKLTREGNSLINDAVESGQISAEEVPDRKTKIELIKNIADQAKDPAQAAEVRKKYGDDLVDHALEQHPIKGEGKGVEGKVGEVAVLTPSVEAKKAEIKKLNDEIDSFSDEHNSLVDIVNKEDRKTGTPKSENEIKLNELQDKTNALIDERNKIEQSLKEQPKAELPKQTEVEKIRAEEQKELDSKIPNAEQYKVDGKVDRSKLTNEEDIKAFDEVYNKYDKLITPLLKEGKVGEVTPEEVDIEKRRQEELDQYASDLITKTELYEDGEGRKYLVHTLKNGKKRLDTADEEGKRTSTLDVYESSVPVGNYIPGTKKIRDIETQPTKQEKRINAKYDAELKALKEKQQAEAPKKRKTAAEKIKERRERKKKETKAEMPPAGRPQVDLPPQIHTAESIDLVDTTGYDKTQKKLIKDAKKVGEAIKDIVKEITGRESKIVIHSNDASFIKAVEKASGEEQSQLRGKGFYFSGDGTIHINMTRASKETIKHEGFHPLLDFIANHSKLKLNELYKQLESIPGIEKLLQDVKDTYAGDSETTIQKEAITDFMAKVADGSIVINNSNFQKIKNFVVKLLNKLGLGLEEAEIMNLKGAAELKELANLVTGKFAKGEKITTKELGDISKKIPETKIENTDIKKSGNPLQFSKTIYGESGITKEPALDNEEYKKAVKSGRVSIVNPYKSLEGKKFAITFPDDLFVGELKLGNDVIAEGNGGVFFAAKNGEKGGAWAAAGENSAHNFVIQANKSLDLNNGEGIVVLSKGNDLKHSTSLEGKVGMLKTFLNYGIKTGDLKGVVESIKEVYSIGNLKDPSKIIASFDEYLKSGRTESGQTMLAAKETYEKFAKALVDKANPLVTDMMLKMGYSGEEYFHGTQLKKGEFVATKKGVNKLFSDLFQEDFLKGLNEGSVYAALKFTSKLEYTKDLSHPSYPFPIRTIDGSPVKLEVFNKTFNAYGKEGIGIIGERAGKPENSFGVATTTSPSFEINKKMEDNPSQHNLGESLTNYEAFKEEPLFSKEKPLPSQPKLKEDAESRKAAESGEVKINSEKIRYNGTDVIGSRERTESEQIASRKEAKEKIKNPETNASLKAANSYNKEAGLPEVTQHKYKPSDEAQQTQVAKLYPKLQDVNSPTYKETEVEKRIFSEYKAKYPKIIDQYNVENYKDLVTKAYDQLIEETQAQYNRLPVKVSFHENGEGNYENNFEMLDDVHNFNHLWVYKGGDDHTALGSKTIDKDGLTANDKFRAVHDYYGHSVEGYQFGKDGEENAWIEHSKMFSPLAQWALSSETRGQNSWVNYSGVNETVLQEIKLGSALKKEGKKLGNQEMIDEGEKLLSTVYDKFVFAEQKAMLLPPQYTDVSKFHDKVIKEVPENLLTYDKANKSRIPSKIGIGKEPIKAEPIKGAGGEKISTGGDVQAPGDVGKGKGDIQLSKEKEVDDLNEMKDILREYTNQGYSLDDVKEIMKDEFGEDYAGEEPTIEQAYNELTTTSIKNKTTARERAERGLDPVVVEAKRSFGEVWDNANKMIDDGEVTPSVLASVIANKPRALSAEESAILLKDRMDISQEYGMKTEQLLEAQDKGNDIEAGILQSQLAVLEERMDINDQAARKSGYELGLGLAARRMLIAKDYSLATQLQRLKAANGGEDVSQEYRGKLKDLINQLDEANNKVYELEKRNLANQVQKGIANTKKVSKSSDDVKKERQSIKEKIADKWGKIVAAVKGKEGEVLYSKAPALVPVTPEKQAKLEAITKDINDLVKSHAESGNTDLKKIIEDIHADISSVIPELTKQDIEDVVTGRYKKEIVKTPLTSEQIKVQADVQRVKTQIDLLKNELELKQRSKGALAMDYLQGWHRFAILSGIPSLGKIAVAGSMRGITSRVEGLVGHALSYIPGVRQIAKGAVREGRFSTAAEAKAFATWFDKMTIEDVKQLQKTGVSDIDIYGGKAEMALKFPAWMEFFGRMHASMKLFPKRAEFFRSLEMRTQDALKNGKDPHDPIVQAELTAGAYNDALRAVFMQDNYVTDAYKAAVNNLQNSGIQGAKQTATALQFIFPIIKVPTNYVAEESSYMIGGLKALYALRKGVSKMTPEQKDYFMRAMKKQSVGIAFMMLGYLNPQALGGYYTGKRKEGELEAGDIELFGTKLPHWMSHSPLFEMLQVGATLRRASDKEVLKGNEPSKTKGIPDVFKGQIKQIPFFGGGGRIEEAFKGGDNFWDGLKDYLSGTVQSITEPQILQNISKWTDTEEGKAIKRLPSGFTEKMMEGTPLRSRLEKEKELFTPDEKEEGILKLLQDKGVELPFIKPRKKIKVIQDEKHPDGVMSSGEYDMYAEKLNKKVKEKVEETLSGYYEIKEGNKYDYKSGKNLKGIDLEDKVGKAEGQASRDVLEEMNLLPKEKRTVTKLD